MHGNSMHAKPSKKGGKRRKKTTSDTFLLSYIFQKPYRDETTGPHHRCFSVGK